MQRDRQLIKDLLGEMEKYRGRNHKEKEEREREEARRIHEASHDNRSAEGRPDPVLPSTGSSGTSHLLSKFELIPIKISFFCQKLSQSPCTIVQGTWPSLTRREFFIFITFLIHIHVLMLHKFCQQPFLSI